MDWTNQLAKVNNKFKFQLFGRNVENLDSCYANIIKFDQNYEGTMSEHAFNLYLNSFGVYLTIQQIRSIKEGFSSQNGQIRYIDFIQNVRDDISPKRLATIDHAWDELSNGEVIQIQSLLNRFDANNHPHARCQVKSPQKIYDDFQHSIKNRSADKKNLNSIQFKEYYLDVNACVPTQRQEYYVDMIIKGLRLDDNRVSIDRLRQMEVVLYQKLRQKTYFKTDQGQQLQKMFRYFDMQDKGVIDFKRFMSVLDKLGCNFSQKQTKSLYQKHSRQDLLFSYQQFCGMMFSMGSGLKDNTNPIFQLAKKDGLVTTQGMSKRLN